jgi:oxygen-dependent protoporphyrinogen oxidase
VNAPAGAPRIAVLGAGITGLAAAHRLGELGGASVTVFEASPRAGGIVATARRGDLVLEDGPDSFITDKPEALALCERVGLGSRLVATRPEFRRSFVVSGGRLVPTPAGFQLLAPSRLGPFLASPLLSWPGRLRAVLEPLVPARTRDPAAIADESLASFVSRRLGRELLDAIAQPMVGGIYGADAERLSMLATFPRFLRLEAEHGSVVRGLRRAARGREAADGASGPRYGLFASLAGGMDELVAALVARLPADALRLATPVAALAPDGPGWRVTSERHGIERFDAVIVALHAAGAGALIGAFDPDLAGRLAALASGSALIVTFAFAEADVAHPRDGAGFVVPRRERSPLLGVSFSDRKFTGRAPAGVALLRAFVDAERMPHEPDDACIARVRAELERLLGVRPGAAAIATRLVRWPGRMPHYEVGHRGRVEGIAARAAAHPGLFLAGNAYGGVGIPDCVRGGETAAQAASGFAEGGPPRD